ncbi:MAG: carboxypeptidase regulatory-like domain-containing protein [Actinobacteria bacterium]|nr:carboxypeptidase regulatory-like domain-containing protein [Actinomycetota bacterium]
MRERRERGWWVRTRGRRTTSLGGATIAVLLVCALAWSPAALAADAGISGKVVNGTRGGAVAGLEVTLHLYRGEAEAGSRVAITDPEGAFSFQGLDADPSWSYQVTATYEEADYQTRNVQLTPGTTTALTLKVYEGTRSPDNLTQVNWVVWVDREGNGAAIQHDIDVVNSGKTTYVGGERVASDKRSVLELPLASGAENLQYLGIFMECCALVQGNTFIHTMPITPGESQATLRYTTGSLTDLSFPVSFPTDSLTLLVPADIRVVAEGLTASGQTQDRGLTYQVLTATDLAVGDDIHVSLSGLEGRGRSPLVLVLVAAAVLAAVAAVLIWRFAGRAARPRAKQRTTTRGTRTAPAATQATRRAARAPRGRRPRPAPVASGRATAERGASPDGPPRARAEADDEAALLVEEIAALDLAFERGILAGDTYHRLRRATKDRLVWLRSDGTGEAPED